MLAGGYQEFLLCPTDFMRIQLPCPERDFELDLPYEEDWLETAETGTRFPSREPGPFYLYIRVMHLRHLVLEFSKSAVSDTNQPDPAAIIERINDLRTQLDTFSRILPPSFQLSESRLMLHSYSSELGAYIMIHLVLQSSYCILHRLGLAGLREALRTPVLEKLGPSFVSDCVAHCQNHALNSANIFQAVAKLPCELPPLDLWFTVCAYQCARTLVTIYRQFPINLSVPAEQIEPLIGSCLDAVERLPVQTDGIVLIKRDLRLLNQNQRSPEQAPSSSPREEQHHVLSRHSLIRQIGAHDQSESLILPPQHPRPGQNVVESRPNTFGRTVETGSSVSQFAIFGDAFDDVSSGMVDATTLIGAPWDFEHGIWPPCGWHELV
ncbi:hypothetical protein N7507_007198 [Penicillium longicatenatum]|nr:hypothetical protein N7507_007198 [Penicillium longicatenatum]